MKNTHDSSLTPLGREQAIRMSEKFPNGDKIDYIMASPLRRTIQTALFAFDPMMQKNKLKIVLFPEVQETSSKQADTGSEVWKLQREFGHARIDEGLVPDNWNSNEGKWSTNSESIKGNAKAARDFLEKLDKKHVILVTHGGVSPYSASPTFDILTRLSVLALPDRNPRGMSGRRGKHRVGKHRV